MIELCDPKPSDKIYDPACGTGGLLIDSFIYNQNISNNLKMGLFGQEINFNQYVLCIINFILNDIKNYNIHLGDTLLDSKCVNENNYFDKIISNIPWNIRSNNNYIKQLEIEKSKLSYYIYPTKLNSDSLFILHIINSLNDKILLSSV